MTYRHHFLTKISPHIPITLGFHQPHRNGAIRGVLQQLVDSFLNMGHLLFRWPWIHPAPASRLVEDSAMFYPLGLSRMDRMSLTPIFNSDGCRTVTRHENLPKPTRDGYGIGDGSGFCHSGSQARSGNYSIYDESRLIILRHHSLTHCHMGRRPIRTQSAFSHSHFTTTSYPHATI